MKNILNVFKVCTVIFILSFYACGTALSSVSISIVTPSSDNNVDVTTQIVAAINDDDDIGITVPPSWDLVLRLYVYGTQVNLCNSENIVYDNVSLPNTITCTPKTLDENAKYLISIYGLGDADGKLVAPVKMTFTTN